MIGLLSASRRLLRAFCRHADLVRVHVDGVWWLQCECGYRCPVLRRDARDPKPPIPIKPGRARGQTGES